MGIDVYDDNGQPNNLCFNARMLDERTIDELIGVVRGVAADGLINIKEAEFLLSWMEKNAKYSSNRIINILYHKIKDMLSDGVLTEQEQEHLLQTIKSITGEQVQSEYLFVTFPLNIPPPVVNISGKYFCLTGKFAYGPRKVCEAAIKERGGNIKSSVSNWVDYLVVGSLCSAQWRHTNYGLKIEDAMLMQDSDRERPYGEKIAIIHEDHWAKYMFRD